MKSGPNKKNDGFERKTWYYLEYMNQLQQQKKNAKKRNLASVFAIFDVISAEKGHIDKVKRFKANPNKASGSKPLPIKVMIGCSGTALDILKKAKALKKSSKFKRVFFNKDLTTVQIVQLNPLIKTRNDENAKLDAKNGETNTKAIFRYGIRNEKVVKINLNGK